MVTVSGQINTVGQSIYLLALKTNNQLCVTATTGGGTLTIPEAPGFSLTFAPGRVTFPGGSKTGCVTVTTVHPDKVPMVPGFGQQPRFIVTIQPSGALFNPPAPISMPNVDGLAPREITEMYSFDHDIGSFVAIGTGTVSDDGQVIRSNPGIGVLKAGWHCGGNPNMGGAAVPAGHVHIATERTVCRNPCKGTTVKTLAGFCVCGYTHGCKWPRHLFQTAEQHSIPGFILARHSPCNDEIHTQRLSRSKPHPLGIEIGADEQRIEMMR